MTLGQAIRCYAIIIVVLAVLAMVGWYAVARWRPSVTQFPIQGVDADERAGAVDWPLVKAEGADFAYVRATYAADGRDARFEANWAGLAPSGLRRGAYHSWSLCKLASDQAANFVRTVPRSADTLPAVLDLAFTANCAARPERSVVLNEIAAFIRIVERHSGKAVMLRVASSFEHEYRVTDAINRPLWSRQMFFVPDYASRAWRMWQANPARRVAGADGPLGWDVVRP